MSEAFVPRRLLFLFFMLGALQACQGSTRALAPGKTLRTSGDSPASESPYVPLDEIKEGTIIDLPTGIELDGVRLMEHLAAARIIYVGEVHDNLEDHRVQLAVLKALEERFPGRIAVGMEMFSRTSQEKLDEWIAGQLDEKAFLRLWYRDWGMDEQIYHDLLSYIHEQKIPLIGLNASKEMVRIISEKGIAGLNESEKKGLPEIDRSDPYYRKALRALFEGHGPGTDEFERFFDTMLLWDETMAQSASQYLLSPAGRDRKLIVFTGGFHVAFGFGVPRRSFRRLREPYRILLPYSKAPAPDTATGPALGLQMEAEVPDIPLYYADFVWAVPYRVAASAHVRLGVRVEPGPKGVVITGVTPGSIAEQGGLRTGDRVIAFDGAPIQDPFDLTYAVQKKIPGEEGSLTLLRDGKEFRVQVRFRAPQ